MNSLNLKPDIQELYKLNEFIYNNIQVNNFQLDLIVEEIFVNIVNYSNADDIKVNLEFNEKDSIVYLEFVDNGIQFNPIKQKEYKPPSDIDSASIGGRGISLVKKYADVMDYTYFDNKNHLKITKIVK